MWGRVLRGSGEHRTIRGIARQHNRQPDRQKHENNCGPRRQTGQQVRRAPRAKRRLRTLSAESSSQIRRFALLQKNDANQKQAYDNVKRYQNVNHRESCLLPASINEGFANNPAWPGLLPRHTPPESTPDVTTTSRQGSSRQPRPSPIPVASCASLRPAVRPAKKPSQQDTSRKTIHPQCLKT